MTFEFSRPFDVEVLTGERTIRLTADAHECAALASRLGLEELRALTAEAVLARKGRRLDVRLLWRAEAVQTCVATLTPIERDYRGEDVFHYDLSAPETPILEDGALDLDAPEPLPEGGLDLGEDVAQALSLALDPFPRRDEAAGHAGAAPPPPASAQTRRPFAGLADMLAQSRRDD